MAKSGLIGPFPLTEAEIGLRIDTTIAAFELGRMEGRKFLVQHIGRADKDAAEERWLDLAEKAEGLAG